MTLAKDRTIIAVTVSLPVLLVVGAFVPDWFRFMLQVSVANGLVVLGVMLQMRAGLVSFGQGLYFCLGGYAAGMAGHFLGVTDAFVLLALGLTVSVLVAAVLGLLMARYREIFFAMLSLAFGMILYGLLVKAAVLGSTDGFNVPSATFLGLEPTGEALRYSTYALTCVVAVAVALLLHRYLTSVMGGLGDAIRDNELRVEYLGVSVRRVVHLKYVMAAGISGLGGVLVAIAVGHVDPDMAYWTTSGEFVFVALLSGTANVAAPFVGAFLLELVRIHAFEYAPYTWQMILGGTMLLVILFLPDGLWSILAMRQRKGRHGACS
ncbi:MAG: branched-chain amino acid ABC transporter permease [Alphaproteobacteria bacterium]